jgi:agmatine deiminase
MSDKPQSVAETPAAFGFRMPAEWEPHQATWIAWPHQRADWPGKFGPIPWVYAEIVRHLHASEEVRILVNGSRGEESARSVLERTKLDWTRIIIHHIATDRVWTRDSGPAFVQSGAGELAAVGWRFNGWAKYPNCKRDAQVVRKIAAALSIRAWQPAADGRRIVLEGGAIDVNGAGCLLTSEECLLSDVQARNPGMTRAEYERLFADYLGVRKVLWLGRGIAGDDTHGHIDDLARFVGPCTVVVGVEKNSADPNYEPLQENLCRLREMTGADGSPLEIVTLPMPEPVWFDGQRLPASYANFYIANDRILVPTFNDPHDRTALSILAELFPGRAVIGIHAIDLVWGLGTLHCMTLQQPSGERRLAPLRAGN